jgi:hypothetical protein
LYRNPENREMLSRQQTSPAIVARGCQFLAQPKLYWDLKIQKAGGF